MASTKKTDVVKIPKTLGGCADLLYELKQKRLEAQKVVAALEAQEKAIKEHIIQTLPKSEATGVAGKLARVTVVTQEVPQVKDYDAFYAYVKKNNAFDLLQRRLSDQAVRERWDAGKNIPGIEPFQIVKVSLNKV